MKFRIAVGGIHIESSTFTPYISGTADFRLREGEELLQRYPWQRDFPEVELCPLVHAGALPGGIVSRAFVDLWLGKFLTALKEVMAQGPLDGLLFDIHGAMSMEGSDDAEGELLARIRELTGPDLCIAASMDLHGNVSDLLFQEADILTCYRTAPHIDEAETRLRAFRLLLDTLKNKQRHLYRCKVDIPILLPGEKTSTETEPGRSLYARVADLCAAGDIMDCSLWMGFPWADQARCHAVAAAFGCDHEACERAALTLARQFWDQREAFGFVGPVAQPEDAVRQALAAATKPFFISDTGDNPGAGGADDMVVFLRDFIRIYTAEKSAQRVLFASVRDELTARQAHQAGIGAKLSIALGGRIDPSFGGPVGLDVTVKYCFEQKATGAAAVLAMGNIDIIVTARRFQYGREAYFRQAGLKAWDDYDIIVVKMGYLEPELSRAARGWVMALSPGAVDQNIAELPFAKLKQPLFPRQSDFSPELRPVTVCRPMI